MFSKRNPIQRIVQKIKNQLFTLSFVRSLVPSKAAIIGYATAQRALLYFVFLSFTHFSLLASDYNVAFVHIGDRLPDYAITAFQQVRLFNQDCPIYVVTSESALKQLATDERVASLLLSPVSTESLIATSEHLQFNRNTPYSTFWRYCSERFFYLYELIDQHNLSHVYHLENDNMLYVDLSTITDIMTTTYPGIAATFDNDERCIPGFLFINNPSALYQLTAYFAQNAAKGWNDMLVLSRFKAAHPNESLIDNLPIAPPSYVEQERLVSRTDHQVQCPQDFCKNFQLFNSFFDAAAFGQYIGGLDPILGYTAPYTYISDACVINPSLFSITWIADSQGRLVPIASYKGVSYRINSLHMHCKKLHLYLSSNSSIY